MKLNNKESKIYFFFWFIYSLLTLIAVINHEPNRDEAQVWLIVRDLNFSQLFSQINIEGHPGLWYLIVMPFAKMGCPYITILLIHWLIAVITTGIFLFKAPLHKITKLLFVFSYFMLFQYSVVARNYCIVILFLFLIASYYQSRFTKPYLYALLLVGLYNTHVLAFGGAVALTFIYFIETRKNGELNKLKYALLIMLCGFVTVIIELFPYSNSTANALIHTSYIPQFNINTYWIILTSIQNAFIPVGSEAEELKIALFFALLLVLFFISNIRKLPVFIFLLISLGWMFYVLSTIHSGGWKHQGLILIFIVFTLWIATYYSNKENSFSTQLAKYVNLFRLERAVLLIISICLAINVIFGLSTLRKEVTSEFSGAKAVADYIIKNNLQGRDIACYRSWRATAVAPYLPNNKFWFVDRKEYGTYFKLDSVFTKYGDNLTDEEVILRTSKKYFNVLLLLNAPLSYPENSWFHYKLLFKNNKLTWGTDDENYFLYELNYHITDH